MFKDMAVNRVTRLICRRRRPLPQQSQPMRIKVRTDFFVQFADGRLCRSLVLFDLPAGKHEARGTSLADNQDAPRVIADHDSRDKEVSVRTRR